MPTLLEILTGGQGAPKSKGPAEAGAEDVVALLFGFPGAIQGLQSLAFLGEGIDEFIIQDKKAGKKAARTDTSNTVKLGKGQFLDVGKLQRRLPEILQRVEGKKLQQTEATAKRLQDSPLFRGIFGEAKGDFDAEFTANVDQAFGALGGRLLGAGSASGFLADPNRQAALLGPVALQRTQFLKGIQKAAEAQALGAVGAGNVVPAAGQTGPQSQAALFGPIFGTGQLSQQNSQFNAGQQLQSNFGNTGAFGDLFGTALGATAGAFGAGGAFGPGGAFGDPVCWVAEELYGELDDRTTLARMWCQRHWDSPFVRAYRRFGKSWAYNIRKRPWIGRLARPIWDALWRAEKRHLDRRLGLNHGNR